MNQVAFNCLKTIETVDWSQKQHRPVRATFDWQPIFQVGPIHVKFAALDTSHVAKPSCPGDYECQQSKWDAALTSQFNSHVPEELWFDINQHAVSALVTLGATWASGVRKRAAPPIFQSKQYCPGQMPSGAATTLHLSWLHNARAKVFDIQAKVAKPHLSDKECDILHNARIRLHRLLSRLRAPFRFHSQCRLSLITLHECHLWLQCQIEKCEHDLKFKRINAWKDKIRASAKSTRAYIYHHLKNKAQDQPNNLVIDQQGHIVYQPNDALCAINEQWDSIFAANIGHDDPIEVLKVLWPYLSRENHPWNPPPITGADIFATLKARNAHAAPGLDGWRTTELQAFPLEICELVAAFFRRLEANADHSIPLALTAAKIVILNKPGPSSPLNKRLITILPPLLLAYTGSRFRQAKDWQASTMPPSIVGGIAGRHMTAIPAKLRLELDEAAIADEAIVGIKLDKSKCFDRIIPAFVAIILLALGCSKAVVSIFVRQYNGLRKHLSYRGWTSGTPTTAPNGVAQGCSFSLIAINAYMRSWVAFLRDVPHLSCRIYIDDIYLWAKIQFVAQLRLALEVTKLWDSLVGQKLNQDKSVVWASNGPARKIAKAEFPGFLIQETFDVLGTKIYTSQRIAFDFADEKAQKICGDIRNIGALPLPRSVKCQLIGSKVIPQCSFAAHITKIPKATLDKIQAEITQALWGQRPHWRAKHLVLGLLAQPHRSDPFVARSFCAILDFVRFLQHECDAFDRCCRLARLPKAGRHTLVENVQNAFATFGLCLDDSLCIGFGEDTKISLREISVRDITPVLKHFAVQVHYSHPANLNRKDFFKPEGFIDVFHTKLYGRQAAAQTAHGPPLLSFFEAQQVGCTITNDRRFAANYSDTSSCRFCLHEKESLVQILGCPDAHRHFQFGPPHEFGSNFQQLGIIEHPWPIIWHRLRIDRAADLVPCDFDHPDGILSLWTDGSVFWGECFPLTAAGFAVIQEDGTTFAAGPVSHLSLSSYSAELWAIVVAAARANCCLCIYSDCREVVTKVNALVENRLIPGNYVHLEWWQFLLRLINIRSPHSCNDVIRMVWIPAHVDDHIPVSMVSADRIEQLGTSRKHIELNRQADRIAKQQALARCAIAPGDKQFFHSAILHQQEVLTLLNKHIGAECLDDLHFEPRSSKQQELQDPRMCFPGLAWEIDVSEFNITLNFPLESPPPKVLFGIDDWHTVLAFFQSLHWKVQEGVLCTYQELAFLFYKRGFRLRQRPPHFQDLVLQLRKCIVTIQRTPFALPGVPTARATKCIGRVLPQGAIVGALPFFALDELHAFSRILAGGAGRFADSWTFSFDHLL